MKNTSIRIISCVMSTIITLYLILCETPLMTWPCLHVLQVYSFDHIYETDITGRMIEACLNKTTV